VAIGRLQSQEGLRYDLQDYGRLLDAMEVAHGTAAVPVPAVADRSAVLRQCSLYLLRLGQEGWWAGTPTFDAAQQRWTVPVYATAGGEDVVTGEIVFDVRGQIEHVHLPDPEPVLSPQVGGVLGEAPGAPLAQRLAAALQWLADIRQELAPRLRAWGEQVARGATHAEAALHTVLAGRSPIIALIHDLSHPSVQVAYAGTGIRRRGGEPLPAGQDTNTVDITTDAMPNGARVTVDENTVRALFLDWQAPSPPLLVLVPDDPGRTPHVPDRVEGEGDTWTIRFTLVPPGAYLLAVAPPGV
jgi:hypothetical protein